MYRTQLTRLTRTAIATRPRARFYATDPTNPRPDLPKSNPRSDLNPNPATGSSSSNNTVLWSTVTVFLLGGGYYYYLEQERIKKEAIEDEERLKQRMKGAVEGKVDELKSKAKIEYDNVVAAGKDKLQSAEDQTRAMADKATAEYQRQRDNAKDSLEKARDSTENLFKSTEAEAERKAKEEKEKAKSTWSSWLGWGQSKAEEGKRDAASKVAEGAEDVKKRAEKHT